MTVILDPVEAKLQNRDPRGVQWAIFPQEGKSLFLIRAAKKDDEGKKYVPDNKYATPEEVAGEWTHAYKAQEAIQRFLDRIWKESEESRINADRREREAARKEAEEIAAAKEEAKAEAPKVTKKSGGDKVRATA